MTISEPCFQKHVWFCIPLRRLTNTEHTRHFHQKGVKKETNSGVLKEGNETKGMGNNDLSQSPFEHNVTLGAFCFDSEETLFLPVYETSTTKAVVSLDTRAANITASPPLCSMSLRLRTYPHTG